MDPERLAALVARAVQWLEEQARRNLPGPPEEHGAPRTFGERWIRLREQRGWSQQELAQRSGVPYLTIYRCERGLHQEPRVGIAAKLARALGVSLDVLANTYGDVMQGEDTVGNEQLTAGVALVDA
jgi:ribosome-binding protein aMBF1 (putative translation factor)